MKLWMLGSGSRGNAALIECDGSRVLIDAGFGSRVLATRLASIGVDPRSIEACFVTHEHHDHARGVRAAARRWGWTVYASPGTASARELRRTPVVTFEPGATVTLDHMTVETTPTPHDAVQSVGFVVTSKSTGARAAVFYDIGHVSRAIAAACKNVDILVLESNHDDEMLRNGPYPPFLQARIASRVGHLDNHSAANLARDVVSRELKHIVLAHLSEENNRPDVALAAMRAQLTKTKFRGRVTIARQDAIAGPFVAGADRATQYSLGL